jgi:hypothetical protein
MYHGKFGRISELYKFTRIHKFAGNFGFVEKILLFLNRQMRAFFNFISKHLPIPMVIFYIKRQTDFNICLCEDSTYYKPE